MVFSSISSTAIADMIVCARECFAGYGPHRGPGLEEEVGTWSTKIKAARLIVSDYSCPFVLEMERLH